MTETEIKNRPKNSVPIFIPRNFTVDKELKL